MWNGADPDYTMVLCQTDCGVIGSCGNYFDGIGGDPDYCPMGCSSTNPGTSSCTGTPYTPPCGNGTVEGIEVCDDGNTVNGDGCDNQCALEATYTCTVDAEPDGTCDTG